MVASTLAPLTTAIDALLTIDADPLDDTDIHDLVVELGRQTSRLEAAHCRIINRWDRRRIWADNGSKSPAVRLARETRMRPSDASRLVHRARALEAMPAATEADAAGEITGAHVDLVARCDRTWRNTTFAESEAVLVDSCTTPWFDNAVRAIDYWKQLADRDTCDDDAELDREGRHAAMVSGWRGEGVLNAVRPQRYESFRLGPIPTLQHPHHRRFQVVIADPARHPTHVLEGPHMAIEEHLLGLVQRDPMEPAPRRRQAQHEHPAVHRHPSQKEAHLPEVDLRLRPERMGLRNLHLSQHRRLPAPRLNDVAAHRRLTDLRLMLIDKALPHPAGSVALLARRLPVRLQPPIDRRLPRVQHR